MLNDGNKRIMVESILLEIPKLLLFHSSGIVVCLYKAIPCDGGGVHGITYQN